MPFYVGLLSCLCSRAPVAAIYLDGSFKWSLVAVQDTCEKRHFAGCLSIIMPLDVDEHVNIWINRLFRFIPEGYVHTFAAWWVVFVVSYSAHRLQWQRSVVLPVHRGEGGRTHVHLRAWDIQGSRPGSRSLTGRESDFWNAHQVRFPRVDVLRGTFFFFFFLPQAALDFLAQENLKAHISCWYIKKYIEEHPEERYGERVIGWTRPKRHLENNQ